MLVKIKLSGTNTSPSCCLWTIVNLKLFRLKKTIWLDQSAHKQSLVQIRDITDQRHDQRKQQNKLFFCFTPKRHNFNELLQDEIRGPKNDPLYLRRIHEINRVHQRIFWKNNIPSCCLLVILHILVHHSKLNCEVQIIKDGMSVSFPTSNSKLRPNIYKFH